MNKLQHIIKDDTRAAMHMAVELCEDGEFDSVTEAFRWLMSESDSTCKLEETESYPSERGMVHVLECSNCGRECEHVNGDYEHCPHCLARNELF